MTHCPYCGHAGGIAIAKLQRQLQGSWAFHPCASCGEKIVVAAARGDGRHAPLAAVSTSRFSNWGAGANWTSRGAIALAVIPLLGATLLLMRSSRTETPARAVAAQTIAAPAIATAPMPAPQTPATVAIAPRAVVTATTGAPVALTETLRTTSAAPSRQTLRVKPSRAVLRAGPGTQFRVLGGAERDQVLEWTTERGGWLQVRTPFEAWIRADLAERSAQ